MKLSVGKDKLLLFLANSWPDILIFFMSEWLYEQAGRVARIKEDFWLDLVNHQILKPTRTYTANVNNLRQFWQLSPFIMDVFALYLDALTETALRLTGKPKLDPEEHAHLRDTVMTETFARLRKRIEEITPEEEHERFWLSIKTFGWMANDLPQLENAVRMILSSQLVLCWTAFETLCGDLARSADKACNGEKCILPPDQSFQSDRQLKQAYQKVFPDSNEIEEIVNDKSLRKLVIVRNVITHSAGVVDEKALNYAKQIAWEINWEVDKPLPLDGEIVRGLASPVIKLGVDLILATDRWLTVKLK
jgi:hypothetical protein